MAPPPLSAAPPPAPAADPFALAGPGDFPTGPSGIPPAMPPDQLFAVPGSGRKKVIGLVASVTVAAIVLAFVFLGGSAGAANLKLVFTPGETHTYSFEITVRGRAGNLQGGFAANSSIAAELTQRTGAVDKSGSATLRYTIRNIHFSDNGRTISTPPGAGGSFSTKIRPDGKVVGFDGGDPFGLESVNPAGQFVGPANAGPLLPGSRITPGQSWTVEATQTLPDVGKLHVKSVNTLLARRQINGNEAADIHSVMSVPLNIHIGRDELIKQAENNGDSVGTVPKGLGISMIGNMHFDLKQTIFTSNGLLQSVLGDGDMTGTMAIEGIPGFPSIVFDLHFGITMTKTSTGQAA
jgi:hypothetical protein